MDGEIIGIMLLALLFVMFVLLRPADRGEGACHGCKYGDGEGCGGGTCPLLKDL